MSNKKRVKFPKYKVFKHTTESKKKNMIGNNPEIVKRKAIQTALNPTYSTNSTESGAVSFSYDLVSVKPSPQKPEERPGTFEYSVTLGKEPV